VHEAGAQALQQFALAEYDRGFLLHALGKVVQAIHRLSQPNELIELMGAAREQASGDGHREQEERRTDQGECEQRIVEEGAEHR